MCGDCGSKGTRKFMGLQYRTSLAEAPKKVTEKLQRVQNAVARLITGT